MMKLKQHVVEPKIQQSPNLSHLESWLQTQLNQKEESDKRSDNKRSDNKRSDNKRSDNKRSDNEQSDNEQSEQTQPQTQGEKIKTIKPKIDWLSL